MNKNEPILDYVLDDIEHFGQYRQDTFSACFWVSCFTNDIFERYGFTTPYKSVLKLDGGHILYKKSVFKKVQQEILENLQKPNFDYFEAYKNDALKRYNEGIDFIKLHVNDEPTSENFLQFLEYPKNMTAYWLYSAGHLNVSLSAILTDALIENNLTSIDAGTLIKNPQTPLIIFQKQLLTFKDKIKNITLDQVKKDPALYKELESFRSHNAWIEFTNWIGEELTLEKLYEQIVNSQKTKDISIGEIPQEIAPIITCIENVMHAKQAGAEYMAMYEFYAQSYMDAIAKKFNITYTELLRLTHDEIYQGLEGNLNVKNIIAMPSRQAMHWVIYSNSQNGATLIDDAHTVDFLVDTLVPKAGDAQHITGQIGNKGVYTGTVKVIMSSREFYKLQDGDVLVTTMTTPDFVLLMQKAGAIVTDVGGMLCHAAIVSRELNKPCVIGTKFATQLLQDGDTVKVDAYTGVVTLV